MANVLKPIYLSSVLNSLLIPAVPTAYGGSSKGWGLSSKAGNFSSKGWNSSSKGWDPATELAVVGTLSWRRGCIIVQARD
jgi:hypothetical protein